MLVVSVQPGQEVMETIAAQLAERGVTDGAVVSLIGAVDECCISNMPAEDASKDILTEYRQPFELTGTGEVKNGKVHLHVVLGREGDAALAGHLHWARVETFFVNAYVLAL
ncbi:DNA-binding protein [Catellatospora sp. KI3]|nr:PPC domain-containing DNA-binding protein [Catellatospora sp. KI3]MDI1461156.1 DNA-binding protein [Catellatospora sp. KI3]